VVAGCNFPNCPRTSIYEASERDYRVVLVDDSVSGLYDVGRREMQNIGVAVLSTAQVLSEIQRVAAPGRRNQPARPSRGTSTGLRRRR